MSSYTALELINKFSDKVFGLGINPKFRENPAISSVLVEMESLLIQMGMMEESEKIFVNEEKGGISFEWLSPIGDKYSYKISAINENSFSCLRQTTKKSTIINGQNVKERSAIEEVATLDEYGNINLITNGSLINNYDCMGRRCNNSPWSEKRSYTNEGIMRDREYRGYAIGELSESIEMTDVNSMLYIPRTTFAFGTSNDMYERRTLLTRNTLDTARKVVENKRTGLEYSAIVPLNQEHGLRDMRVNGGDPYPTDYIIKPLSNSEIEEMIKREKNEKVEAGLRKYAAGREQYSYNPLEDPYFVYKEGSVEKTNRM